MKRIAILMWLALLADVEPVLAREGARAGGPAVSAGRPAGGSFAGARATHNGGQSGAHHAPRGNNGHNGHSGHNHGRLIGAVILPWWWYQQYHHHHYSSTVVVTTPVYTPVPVPVYVEQGSDLRYYCPDYRDYYPNVATCPSQWLQVVPAAAGYAN